MHVRLRTALAAIIVSLLMSIVGLFGAQPAQAAANCPLHYWCGFEYTNFGGQHLSWSTGDQGGGFCTSLPAAWKNRISSIDNDTADTDHPILLFHTTTCGGSHYTIAAGTEVAVLPSDWSDDAVAFIY